MIHPEELLYIPTLNEGRLPMIKLEEVPGIGITHDAATMTYVPLSGIEEYLDRNYVIVDDPDQVEVFKILQIQMKRRRSLQTKTGITALGFSAVQFALPVALLIGIYATSLIPPFRHSIGPFDQDTAALINNISVIGIAGIGGAYALIQVFRQVDFKSAPVPAYAGLVGGLTWLGIVVFRLLVI
jgi:hypothetical protein